MSELISDEEIDIVSREEAYDGSILDSDRRFARRIESLVRRRLAERLHGEVTQERTLAEQWERQIKAGDRDSISGFNRSHQRIGNLKEAIRIIEGEDGK